MRRAVILLPNGFTLVNLFFGIFAIVAASRGDFDAARRCTSCSAASPTPSTAASPAPRVPAAGSARSSTRWWTRSRSGSRPALIMYFAVLNQDGWDWLSSSSSARAP